MGLKYCRIFVYRSYFNLSLTNSFLQGPDGEPGKPGSPGLPGEPGADVSRHLLVLKQAEPSVSYALYVLRFSGVIPVQGFRASF